MNNLRNAFKKLLIPVAVLLLVAAVAIVSPFASMVGAIRVHALTTGDPAADKPLKIENLPARYATVNTELTKSGANKIPSISGKADDNQTKVTLAHAGEPELEITAETTSVKYEEAGKYEWRFYYNDVLFDAYTVSVTQAEYGITMPDGVVTVAPKNITELTLPKPEKYIIDGKEVDTLPEGYALAVKASLGTKTIDTTTAVGEKNVTIKFVTADGFENDADKVGTLKVTYLLKKGDKKLVAEPLADIEIKNIKNDEVTFASSPSAPSVSSLSFKVPVTLSKPSADSAKYKNTSFAVEADTQITTVKFVGAPTQPSNWDNKKNKDIKVIEVKPDAKGVYEDEYIKIDGLTVTAKKLGWYKFEFTTTTLFGYKTEDDTKGVYWSDAVHIKQDEQAPQFKWVDQYSENDIAGLNDGFEDNEDVYAKYLPMTDKPDSNTTKKITVAPIQAENYKGIVLPAIFPHDNNTAYDKLEVSVTAEQIQDRSGKSVSNNNIVTVTNSGDAAYKPGERLSINFPSSQTDSSGNTINLKRENGLYRVTVRVQEKRPSYDNGAADAGWARSVSKYLYFVVDDTYEAKKAENAPLIDEAGIFQVSDVYLWEGNTFDFKVPTVTDAHTATSKLAVDYYLVSVVDDSKAETNQAIKLNKDNISSNGRMTVDLDDLGATLNKAANHFYIYAVARNYYALQAELVNGEYQFAFDASGNAPENYRANGVAWKSAEFNIHDVTAAHNISSVNINVASGTYTAGEQIHINKIETTWNTYEAVDNAVSVAVYRVKADKTLVPVDVYDSATSSTAEIISTVMFNNAGVASTTKTASKIENLYFTPGVGDCEYQIVVTVKEHASATRYTMIKTLHVNPRNNYVVSPSSLNAQDTTSTNIDASIALGESAILPNYTISNDAGVVQYLAKNRELISATNGAVVGHYTVTVKGVNDANCVIGNKFVPNKTGTYTFEYKFYNGVTNTTSAFQNIVYRVEVIAAENSVNIKVGDNYGDTVRRIWASTGAENDSRTATSGKTNEPEYAITLSEFTMANIGGNPNFIVSRATMKEYLEKITDSEKWMYPAIAIPMPNVINDSMSSDEVEITVQKSGSSDYLVSSKKQNTTNGASVIGKIGGYYVFRPEGEFTSNGADYMKDATNANGVYVVTYSTKTTSLTYNITFGDPNVGALKFEDGFLTYNNGKKINEDNATPVIEKNSDGQRLVTIDLTKLTYTGNSDMLDLVVKGAATSEADAPEDVLYSDYMLENARVSVTYEGNSFIDAYKWSSYDVDDNNAKTYVFDCNQGSGTYKVTVSLYNKYTQSTVTQEFEFTIDVKATKKNVNLNTVWGIILIVLSVGLLAGVIFYFVKTSRETRFMDTPKKAKVKKEKQPKAVEDKHEDVK